MWGRAEDDVFAVGGDPGDGGGPLVYHFDGASWTRLDTGQTGNLWWVHGFVDGPLFLGGDGGMILRYEGGAFTRLTTPGLDTVFGLWGSSPTDMWAVGGALGGARGAFAWRLAGDTWSLAPGFPGGLTDTTALWKMAGRSADDAWIVGTNGRSVRWNGTALTEVSTGAGESLFTVHADARGYVAVGGYGTGSVFATEGETWRNISPAGVDPLIGVVLGEDGDGYAVGQYGSVLRRDGDEFHREDLPVSVDEALHSVWIDPTGGVWTVGGQILTSPITDGIMFYKGSADPGELP